jgi:type VI secretion system protein ImpH
MPPPPAAITDAIANMDFFRAVRLLDAAHPELPRTGQAWTPAQESVRFGQRPELTFAGSPLHSFERATETSPPRINLNFLGLLGPNGPFPLHITEYIRDRLRNHHDSTLVAFFNLFHHRIATLFYRAWMVNQQAVELDRPAEQNFAYYIGSFIGDATAEHPEHPPANSRLYFAGRLASQTRNAEGLESILREFFDIPAVLESHVGRWLPIPAESRLRLSGSPRTAAKLGATTIVGSRVWDTALSFRLHFGPMSFVDYQRLLPGGESFQRLREWLNAYTGPEYFWDIRLILKAAEIPKLRLGRDSQRLGLTTWLHSKPPQNDVSDLTLTPPEART